MTRPSTHWPATTSTYELARYSVAPGALTDRSGRVVAGFGRRALGSLVDLALAIGIFVALVLPWDAALAASGIQDGTSAVPGPVQGAALLVGTIVIVLGPSLTVQVLCPLAFGASPGKALLRLELAGHRHPAGVGVGALVARWATCVGLYLVPFGLVLSYAWPLWNPRRATLHDLAAGTAVVRRAR